MQDKSLEEKIKYGLSKAEVDERIENGQVNGDVEIKTKSYGKIFRDNLFSLFNLINVILFTCIAVVHSWRNGLFFFVVFWNFAIGSIQEIRAKKTVEKLSLISAPKAKVIRDGEDQVIHSRNIVLGDIMKLKSGNQICADCIVLDGTCQVNESLVTGESEPITKEVGDHLLSGSFIVSGNVRAEVEHVGVDNYATKITLGAKYQKKSNSIIMKAVKDVVKIVAIALIPLAGLMIWKNFFAIDQSFSEAMVAVVASISAMIPGGLILLVSMVMAVSVVRLSAHKTLAQDLYCVEYLARVDVLCMDKTGTITEGSLAVEDIIDADIRDASYKEKHNLDLEEIDPEHPRMTQIKNKIKGTYETNRDKFKNWRDRRKNKDNPEAESVLAYEIGCLNDFAEHIQDENETIEAIRSYLNISQDDMEGSRGESGYELVAFDSKKKWSMVKKAGVGSFVLGAPEYVISEMTPEQKELVNWYAGESKRVLTFAFSEEIPEGEELPERIEPMLFIVISDHVRDSARETLEYFKREGVALKVISGDNPVTVSKIAIEAGLDGAENYIDATTLESYDDIREAVDKYSVFGRVTPYQKLDIIKALKEEGHTVAMIGDGANDVLALKEADCSIAMQSGSDAARNVSSMVLLDSDFSTLPLIVAEGRKSINNLQRSAGLYLTKTTYAFILTIVFLFATFTYPFQSVQVTLVGAVTIGMPSFFLALEPNSNRIKEHFLKNVLKMAIPSGILSALAIISSVVMGHNVLGASTEQIQTIATFTAIIIGFIVILDICGKMNKWKWILMAWLVFAATGLSVLFPKLFFLVPLTWWMWVYIAITAGIFFLIHGFIFRILYPRLEKKKQSKEGI